MTKLYVVTSGSYSDYCIRGIYSTKEKADEAALVFGKEPGEAEEWELDTIPETPTGKYWFEGVMFEDGSISYFAAMDNTSRRSEMGPSFFCSGIRIAFQICVCARDKEHAIKIANEKRLQLIASGEWERERKGWFGNSA